VELSRNFERWDALVIAGDRNLLDRRSYRSSDRSYRTVWTAPYDTDERARMLNWASYAVTATMAGLRRRRPDVVYASSPHLLAGLAGLIIARVRRAPFVLEIRDIWPKVLVDMGRITRGSRTYWVLRHLERFLYRQADHVVVLAEGVHHYLTKEGVDPEHISFVPNGSDLGIFERPCSKEAARERFGLSGLVFTYAGAHGPANGLDLVLDAAAEVQDELPEVHFVLVGDGAEKQKLVERARRDQLDNVVFLDPIPKSEMPTLLAASDVGLHVLADVPLFRYGVSPNKIFDYMAAAIPVLTNTEGEVTRLVEGAGAGVAVEAEKLVEGVRTICATTPEQRDEWGANGRRFIEEHRSRPVLAAKLEAALDLAMQQSGEPSRRALRRRRPYRGQRALDWALLTVFALPALVVGGLAALAIRLTSRGPVLFRQERVGMGGEPFEVVKFRTMVHLDEPNPLIPDPNRITRVGAFLRRFSLDELPQLLNVARGEMSIVGPRPTLAYQVERYSDRERHRLRVRPGLTGLAQVNGRNAIVWSERIEHDLDYVDRQSLVLDLSIIARTFSAVVGGSGVEGHAADDPLSRPESDPDDLA
jgi:lipopolysaccharide/colanic/teichoic acid biosynthesis glycosyltransferase/glycosyltransferase involved in cell wall biosynthesis